MSIVNQCGVQSLSMRSASMILLQLLLSIMPNWLQIGSEQCPFQLFYPSL